MISEKLKLGFRNYLIGVCTILITLTFFAMVNFLFVSLGDEIQDLNYGVSLTSNVKNKNLTLPFPFKETSPIIKRGTFDEYTTFYMDNFDKDLDEFHNVLVGNYYYDSNYDCKYWAYVWTLYWKENYKKYNWEIEYIDTENHVFVMVSNSTGYCIMDGKDLICMGLN